jgi:hypothetical protein
MSLTSHIKDKDSPVRQFLETEFPNAKPPRQVLEMLPQTSLLLATSDGVTGEPPPTTWHAPPPSILPKNTDNYPWPTVGTAFDYRLRFHYQQFDVARLVARNGARLLAQVWRLGQEEPQAFIELVARVQTSLQAADGSKKVSTKLEQQLAEYSYVLALYEQCYRAPAGDDWPIMRLGPLATMDQLVATAPAFVLDDIKAMSQLVHSTQPSMLSGTDVTLNPSFGDASVKLGGADADLVVDGRLIDIKSKKVAEIERVELWQLLGYAMADADDFLSIQEVGIYFSRHGIQVVWPLKTLMELMSGKRKEPNEVRERFQVVLQTLGGRPRIPIRITYNDDWTPPNTSRVSSKRLIEIFGDLIAGNQGSRKIRNAPVANTLVFRPTTSHSGKWHVAYSENQYVYPPTNQLDLDLRPSCGSPNVTIDRSAKPLKLVKGTPRNKYAAQCCTRCLEYADRTYKSVGHFKTPKIGPEERWRYGEPRQTRQKWHIKRSDFYVNDKSRGAVCSAAGDFKPRGVSIPVAEAKTNDPRICQHCLRIVVDGAPRWLAGDPLY